MKRLLFTLTALFLVGCSEADSTGISDIDRRCHVEDVIVQVIRHEQEYLSDELQKWLTNPNYSCKLGMSHEWISIGDDGKAYRFVSETWDCTKCSSWR